MPSESSIDLLSWINIVETSYELWEKPLEAFQSNNKFSKNNKIDSEIYLTFFHEVSHFWQAISTTFVFNLSSHYFEILSKMRQYFELSNDINSLYSVCKSFESNFLQNNIVSLRFEELTALDIIEGFANHNAYRMVYESASHSDFVKYIDEQFSDTSPYKKAYQYLTNEIGEFSYDLFSLFCYMSLQTVNPAQAFVSLARLIKSIGSDKDLINQIIMTMSDTINGGMDFLKGIWKHS